MREKEPKRAVGGSDLWASVSTDGGHTEGRPGGRGEGYRGHSYASYTRGAEQYGVSVKQHTHTHTHTHTHVNDYACKHTIP